MSGRILLISMLLVGSPVFLRADATLLLQQPYGTFGAFNPTGHAAVYLSRVCAETPTYLRRCGPGELGVVISRYHKIAGKDWIAVPLVPYLYAVEDPEQVPVTAEEEAVALLRDTYRREHLQEVAPDDAEGLTPRGEWTQLVGASYERSMYGFSIETSEAQDDALIRFLNKRENKSHFNIFFRNCADFSRMVMNFYYPKALRRSIIADAGITTPKQMAKSLVKYSRKHPELEFSTFYLPQIPGGLERSKPVRGVIESLLRSKKYAVPLIVLYPWVATGGGVAYLTKGRFNPSRYARAVYHPEDLQACMATYQPNSPCERVPQTAATVHAAEK